ncbi:MAG: tetratricopeptide repeat protein [Acidobacteria bacterium]|nr:MAG: tetratricopeptide repeat protein [Acidobacteriota bacterium]
MSFRHLPSRALIASVLATVMVSFALRGQDLREADAQAMSQEAYEALQRGNAALAVREYRQLLEAHPEMVAARANLATALVSLGRFDEAIAQYQMALKEEPDNSSLRFNLALACFRKGDYLQAAQRFGTIHNGEPNNVRIATLLANCELHLRQVAQAIALLKPLEKSHPNNLDLEWILGMALIRAAHPREGLERVQKVADRGYKAEAYELAAVVYMGLTDFDKARSDAEAAIRIDPHASNAYLTLAMLDGYSGDENGAAEEYEKALKANPQNLQARTQLGIIFYNQRKLDDARQQFNEALALNPRSLLTLYELARVERAQEHLGTAVKDLESCVHEDPQWLPPHIELAALYYILKRPQEGAKEKAIVQRLMAEKQQHGPEPSVTGSLPPSP